MLMSEHVNALERLTEMEHIAATFVYDEEGRILASAVPPHYNDATLAQLVMRIRMVVDLVRSARVNMKEVRLGYEAYTLWLKAVGRKMTLAIFVEPNADISAMRQPINLAAVTLEKAILTVQQASGTGMESRELASLAQKAEVELMLAESGEEGEASYRKLTLLAEFFLGPSGPYKLEKAMREKQIRLPYHSRGEMQKVVDLCAEHIHNIDRRKRFIQQADDLMDTLEGQWTSDVESGHGG